MERIRDFLSPDIVDAYDEKKGYDDLEDMRQELVKAAAETDPLLPPRDVVVSNESIESLDGSRIKLRIIRPCDRKHDERLPVLLWIHGGGFVLPESEMGRQDAYRFASFAHCIVVSVLYRLAPQYKFPKALEDCYSALQWIERESRRLNADLSRIAVGGTSAGGNLAIATAFMTREKNGPEISFLMPLYAVLDNRHLTPSTREITDPKVWCRAHSVKSWQMYLGKEDAFGKESPLIAPLQQEDLSGLPPTYICVGQQDLLRDDNILFASRLMQAGVPVELHVYPGLFHASNAFAPEAASSKAVVQDYCNALKRAFYPAGQEECIDLRDNNAGNSSLL